MLSVLPVPGCNNPSYSTLPVRVCRRNVALTALAALEPSTHQHHAHLLSLLHPPALQETKGTCSRPGSSPFSKLRASDQSHPQPQSKPRQVQVALPVPQLTRVYCLHWLAQLAILQRPAFYHLCLARACQGHETRRGGQQRC